MNKKGFIQRRDRMNRVLLSNSASVVSSWLEGERIGKEYVAINPLRDDETLGSFNINLTTGVWKDFADDDFAGPDLVSLYMRLHGLDESAATRRAGGRAAVRTQEHTTCPEATYRLRKG